MNIFGTTFDYQSRLGKVRKLMDERSMDAILVHLWPNQYFLSGMYQHAPWYPIETVHHTETPLIVFRDEKKEPVFLITYLTGNGLKEATWIKDVRLVDKEPYGKRSWYEYVAEALREKGADEGVIGLEKDICVLSTFEKLQSALPNARFKAADEVFHLARTIKEPEEISLIKESVAIAEAGLEVGMKTAKVGVLETEIQAAAEIEMKRRGAIREVETMCQSGKRTANYRAFAANWKRVEENDLVTIDIGCVYKGYGSDLTRTWVAGKPTGFQQKIADDMVSIRGKLINIMKPGLVLGELLDLGRSEMSNAGYLTASTILPSNKTGFGYVSVHGIGLGPMHDPPHVTDREMKLQSGMTLAFTCSARFEDFTIRFEDDLVVGPEGVELMNKNLPWHL